MTNERAIQILENLISINGDIIIGDEGREALEMAVRSLQQEQQEEPDKSLEEAAYNYSFDSRPSIYGQVDVIDAFKAGAEWQASQMPMPEDTVLFQKGVAEGRRLEREDMTKDGNVILAEEDFDAEKEKSMEWGYNLCKEQMLKDALEAKVVGFDILNRTILLTNIPTDLNMDDKVRILVLKAEED